ncbi:tetratricopeptide (TPR) repeat protein [Caulobacter ginsengisoli]|uniref:Tetratricopeptide (TPR) repeat protein n=1 Tax=Caulobacter ginsengisoli TaxID=400775 RepID=A0ABU0IUX0_9CAUL|nr:tetratricopeptide repeat protein [Caulobacter ginsengisoli]MDQ0465799.1 tetratricopeptide (TPR) repeat protein [Caulobacter ginsengisoli]
MISKSLLAATAGLTLSLVLASSAGAADSVVGGNLAKSCAQSVFDGARDDAALQLCTQAIATDLLSNRDLARTYINRGVLQLRRKAYDRALADFDRAATLAPDMGEAFVNQGAALIAQRRYDLAVNAIDRGLALGASSPERAYYNRALANLHLDNLQAAYGDLIKASQLAPDWDVPRRELAKFPTDWA